MECKNHGETTYISVAGNNCCASCFKPIEIAIIKKDITSIRETEFEYLVIKNNDIVKGFSKFDDFGYTNARNFMNALS